MRHYKNFTQYVPTGAQYADLLEKGVGFCRDELGRDWYELRDTFSEDTIKVVYSGKTIFGAEQNAHDLNPLGCSVIELESLPDGFKSLEAHLWMIQDEVITKDPSVFAGMLEQKAATTLKQIQLLKEDISLGITEDTGRLRALTDYYKELRMADPALGVMPEFKWEEPS